jgi:ParB/RepB/Spo0J family partition protein
MSTTKLGIEFDDEGPELDEAEVPAYETTEAAKAFSPELESLTFGETIGYVVEIPLAEIDPDPEQARDEGADDDLAPSILANGVLEPIRVYRHPDPASGKPWRIDNGERRYRGAVKAGLTTIPGRPVAVPAHVGEKLLRQNLLNDGKRLKPMEEARSWKKIMDAYGWKLQQLAVALGRAKSTVSDRLAMLSAPAPFQPLFSSGALPAAAAPIVRKYSDVPEGVLTALVKSASGHSWRDFVETETPIPLDTVKRGLQSATYGAGLRNMADTPAAKTYAGATCTIEGRKWATDGKAYDKAVSDYYRDRVSVAGSESAAEKAQATREATERKKQRAKAELRRAQFAAISAKLPTSIGGSVNGADWPELLVTLVMQEVHRDTLRVLAAQLGLTGRKSRHGGMAMYGDMIKRHAKTLNAQGRVKLALQLLLAPDLNFPSYIARGPERFAAAAKLLKLDLGKIKPPADAKTTKAPAKPSTKKGR